MPTRRLTGSRIRERRLDQGLRQAAVAQAVGISPSYLNLIEHNRRRIGGKLLGDLARVLGVDAALLTEGADSDLLDQLRSAAAIAGEAAEVARAEELAGRYPGWASLIALQARRIAALEERVRSLTDRMAYDPQLAASLHEVISAVTAIRSSSSILVGQEVLDADWQRRFHENIHDDSRRLAASSEALIAYLEAPDVEPAGTGSPVEELEAYLARTGFHIAALEVAGSDPDHVVEASGLMGASAALLRAFCSRYVQDALALPLSDLTAACSELGYNPAAIAARFDIPLSSVLRRLACLPPDAGHPPLGLVECDASGALTLQKPVPGFAIPRAGGACPLWPVFAVFARPSQPLVVDVALPGAMPARFLCCAVSEIRAAAQFATVPVLQSTMLVIPDPAEGTSPPQPVGVSCRICTRSDCIARREPAMAGVGP